MARREYNITWTAAQNDRLKQAVKAYNKELQRQAKALPEALRSYLPQKIRIRDARKEIGTRDELRSFERRLAREVREGLDLATTQKGVVLTRGQLKDLERRVAQINRQRAERLERYQLSPNTPTKNRFYMINLQPKDSVQSINQSGWDRFVQSVYNQSRQDYWEREESAYKEIYLGAIKKGLGNTDSYDLLAALVEKVPPSVLYEAQFHDPYLTHFMPYPGKNDDPNELAAAIWTHWGNYLDEKDLDIDWDAVYAQDAAAADIYAETGILSVEQEDLAAAETSPVTVDQLLEEDAASGSGPARRAVRLSNSGSLTNVELPPQSPIPGKKTKRRKR